MPVPQVHGLQSEFNSHDALIISTDTIIPWSEKSLLPLYFLHILNLVTSDDKGFPFPI